MACEHPTREFRAARLESLLMGRLQLHFSGAGAISWQINGHRGFGSWLADTTQGSSGSTPADFALPKAASTLSLRW